MKRYLLGLFSLVLAGCGAPDPKGVTYVDPGTPGRYGGTGIESQDISAAAHKAVQSILELPQITQANKPPVVLIASVTNRSASPINTDLYTTKLRGILMSYGGGKVHFLARDAAFDINKKEMEARAAGEIRADAEARNAHTYDYILTAEVQGISGKSQDGQSEYFLVAFKLIDIHDLLLWEDQYEIKKEGRDSSVYR